MSSTDFVRYLLVPSGLVSFGVNIFLGIFVYLQNRQNVLHRFFAIFALSVGGWSVGSSIDNLIADERVALQMLRVCYISASFLPTFFLHFALVLTQQPLRRCQVLRSAYAISTLFAP